MTIPLGTNPLLQLPFESAPLDEWQQTIWVIFNLGYAFAIRGYLLLIVIGCMIYVTGIADSLSKLLIGMGIVLHFGGPFVIAIFADAAGVPDITLAGATYAWIGIFGMSDDEVISLVLSLGHLCLAICILTGAILYFTPSSNDYKTKGQSLIVRGLMFAPVLIFFQLTPWI